MKYFLIVYGVLLSSCTGCVSEEKVDLGNGYFFIPFREVVFDVSRFGGNGIFVYIDRIETPVVFPKIEKYAVDSSFITVKQNLDLRQTRILFENMVVNPQLNFGYNEKYVCLSESIIERARQIPDSLIRQDAVLDSLMRLDPCIQKWKPIKSIIGSSINL